MPRLGDIFPSRFLKETDLSLPLLLTIRRVAMEEIGRGNDRDTKAIVSFKEIEKELTLNKTNAKRIEKFIGSDDTDAWAEVKIVVYWDPDVEFGGEIVGGVRVRAPKNQASVEQPQSPEKKSLDDPLPF